MKIDYKILFRKTVLVRFKSNEIQGISPVDKPIKIESIWTCLRHILGPLLPTEINLNLGIAK